ncbi:MAG TPA: hypothetical protein VIY49_01910 [Bryobacteraceae bacterium]
MYVPKDAEEVKTAAAEPLRLFQPLISPSASGDPFVPPHGSFGRQFARSGIMNLIADKTPEVRV